MTVLPELRRIGAPATVPPPVMRCPVCKITVLTSSDNLTGHCTQHKERKP